MTRKVRGLATVGVAVVFFGCAARVDVRPDRPADSVASAPQVARGTLLSAQLRQPLSTEHTQFGDRFSAELLDPVLDGKGELVVPAGAIVEGVVGRVAPSRFGATSAQLQLDITGVRLPGTEVWPMGLEVAETASQLAPVWPMGVLGGIAGAAAGAGTGLIIDDTRTSLIVGSVLVGFGIGVVVGVVGARRDATIASGSLMTLRVTEPISTRMGVALQRSGREGLSREPLPPGEERRTGGAPASDRD